MVSNQPQEYTTENEDSLAHLSAQLKAHGYITRSLDLLSLFSLPPPPLLSSHEQTDKQLRTALKQAALARQAEDQAREQIVRCLWNMLGARVDATTAIERLSTELRVLLYDHERANGILAKEREKRLAAEKDAMAEKAKAKASADALTAEMARHRHAKEELTKSRSALQFVKTQAQHDQKRRESELASALQRLQRQTSDPLQPKFTIINPITKAGRAPAVASRLAHAGELALLEDALEECDSSRKRAQEENGELRELVGEVEEWSTEMIKLRGVGPDNPVVEPLDHGLPRHLTASVDVLAPSVYQKLHEIRTSIVTLIETTDEQIKHAQDEMEEALETERFALVAEKLARTAAEKQLEEAAIQIAASEKLVFDFANDRLFAGPAMEGTPVKRGAMYDDETPAQRAVLMSLPVMESDSQRKASEERNQLLEEVARVAQEKVEVEKQRAGAAEAKRALDVAAFLSELGDSPAPVSTTLHAKVAPPPIESSPMIPEPTIEMPAISKLKKSSSQARQLETLVEQSFSDSIAPLNDLPSTSSLPPPSPFLSSAPAVVQSRSAHEQRRTSALADILSMADSPPLRPAPLVSSRGGSMAAREARERAALEAGGKENEFLESVQVVTKQVVTTTAKRDGGEVKGKQRETVLGRSNVF